MIGPSSSSGFQAQSLLPMAASQPVDQDPEYPLCRVG